MQGKTSGILIGCFLIASLWSCDRNQGEETCVMTAITNAVGDTVTTLEYEEGRLVRINERNPVSIRRFLYDDSLLIKEEFFGISSTLQRYRSYFYEDTSRLVGMVEYRVNLSGEWLPAYRESYSEFLGGFPRVMKSYSTFENEEVLSSYCDFSWVNGLLIKMRRWEQVPSAPERLRVVEVQTYSYDSPPSPWPDIPAIPQWQRMKNPIFIDSRTIEYLPQGNTTEAFSRKEFEYRYDKENRVVEVLISEPSTRDKVYEFHYSCELAEP